MPMRQWCEHWDHYLDEPYGWEIEQYRHGQLLATITNMSGRVSPDLAWPQDFYLGQLGRAEDPNLDEGEWLSMDEVKARLGKR